MDEVRIVRPDAPRNTLLPDERPALTQRPHASTLCGKQTQHGFAAWKNTSGFAPCIKRAGHQDACYSGTTPTPPKAA